MPNVLASVACQERDRRVNHRPAPRPYTTVAPPPPGTRIRGRISRRLGVVQKYRPGHPLNLFPVAWLDGSQMWELVGADDVQVVVNAAARSSAA